MALQLGQRLGPYEILSVIGAGAMGEVYEARDTKLGRKRSDQFQSKISVNRFGKLRPA